MAVSPGLDVANHLAGARTLPTPPGGSVTLALGVNLFVGPLREVADGVPDQAVFCLQSGGAPRAPYLGTTVGASPSWNRPRVQVIVRGLAGAWDESEALARAVLERLHIGDFSAAGYFNAMIQESEPLYVGQDERGLHLWSVNVELWWKG